MKAGGALAVVVVAAVAMAAAHPGHAAAGGGASYANERLANQMAAGAGWDATQQQCLDDVESREDSTWSATAVNPGSGAYGIPQALPGSKMASAGADWQTDPATQVRWMLGYIGQRYGDACTAWEHEQQFGWY